MDGGRLIIYCSHETKTLTAQKAKLAPKRKATALCYISALFVPSEYGMTPGFLQILLYITIRGFSTLFSSDDAQKSQGTKSNSFSYSDLKYLLMTVQKMSDTYSKIPAGHTKLEQSFSYSHRTAKIVWCEQRLLLPMSWQKGKGRNHPNPKIVLSMTKTQNIKT